MALKEDYKLRISKLRLVSTIMPLILVLFTPIMLPILALLALVPLILASSMPLLPALMPISSILALILPIMLILLILMAISTRKKQMLTTVY